MRVIEYYGKSATARHVRRADFDHHNVDHPDVVFNVLDIRTRGQAELTDEAAELLLQLEPLSFREVEGDKLALKFRKAEKRDADK